MLRRLINCRIIIIIYGEDIGRSFLHKKCVSAFGYLAAFSNTSCSKLSDVENDVKFRTFWPHVKIRGGVGEISIPIVEALLRPNLPNTFYGHPLRGCWAPWIDKKETESSWVKLKAFPTNVGQRPNNSGPIQDIRNYCALMNLASGRLYIVPNCQLTKNKLKNHLPGISAFNASVMNPSVAINEWHKYWRALAHLMHVACSNEIVCAHNWLTNSGILLHRIHTTVVYFEFSSDK